MTYQGGLGNRSCRSSTGLADGQQQHYIVFLFPLISPCSGRGRGTFGFRHGAYFSSSSHDLPVRAWGFCIRHAYRPMGVGLKAMYAGIARFRRSLTGVHGDYEIVSVAVGERASHAGAEDPGSHSRALFITSRGTSYIFCRCRRDRDHCGQPCFLSAGRGSVPRSVRRRGSR